MKAKRILSLLLTVVMIAACSVTSFAVTLGENTQATVNETFASAFEQAINAEAVKADPDKLAFGVAVTQIPDDEFLASLDATSWADLELDDTWGAYIVKISLNNIGTVVKKTDKGIGYTIGSANIYYVADADNYMIMDGTTFDSDFDTNCFKLNDVNGVISPSFSSTGANVNYPLSVKTVSGNIDNFVTINILVKDDTVFEFDGATVVYSNYVKKSAVSSDAMPYVEGTKTAFVPIQYAAWAPASITFSADAPVVVGPAITKAEAVNKSGVTTLNGDVRYDNAYEIKVTLTAAAGSAVGVEFVPAFMSNSIDDIWQFAAETTEYSAALGAGTTEFRAALIGVPVDVKDAEFQMYARPFVKNSEGVKTYGEVVIGDFQYTIPK